MTPSSVRSDICPWATSTVASGSSSRSFDAIFNANMIHISPWATCLGLFRGAAHHLRPGGRLFLYGPFRVDGEHTAPSNAAFDADLRRRDPSWGVRDREAVERFRAGRLGQFAPLLSKAARWAADNLRSIADRDPALPGGLDDRAQDSWRILVAIADQVGGHWPETARAAAVALSSEAAKGDDSLSAGVLLLRDIREVMGGRESITSTVLVDALVEMDEAPWREWRRGSPITTTGIARLLKPYKVRPYRGKGASVYRASDLDDAWSRYLDNAPGEPSRNNCETANCDPTATENYNDFNEVSRFAVGRSCEGVAVGECDDTDVSEPDARTIRGVI